MSLSGFAGNSLARPDYSRNLIISYYTINSRPIKPILFDELPADIKKLMSNNILQIEDFGKQNVIEIDNAY